jgi:hypothetical protein
MRWAVHVALMGVMRNSYGVFMGKEEGHRLFGRLGCRREENI